jgi:hypothetical protein
MKNTRTFWGYLSVYIRCFLRNVPALFTVYSVVYKNNEIIIDVGNGSYISTVCNCFEDYVTIIDSIYTNGKVDVENGYNFKFV